MAVSLVLLIPAFLVFLLSTLFLPLIQSTPLISLVHHQTTSSSCSDHNSIQCQLEQAKLKIARLESIFQDRIRDVSTRSQKLIDCEHKIELLNSDIDRLKTALSSFQDDFSRANQRITALEEEVRLLWAASRKNNFEIHDLEIKALDAERRLKEFAAQIGEMEEIVSEQWIQIQQLEQAVYMAEVRTWNIRKELWRRCPYVKFFMNLFSDVIEALKEILNSLVPQKWLLFCTSQGLKTFSSAKHFHHQLQDMVKDAMKSNEFTSALAHEEVVFFVASAIVAFPIMTVCMLLLSQFN